MRTSRSSPIRSAPSASKSSASLSSSEIANGSTSQGDAQWPLAAGTGASGRLRAGPRDVAGGGESPPSPDAHPDADALRIGAVERVDAAALDRERLAARVDVARLGVGAAALGRGHQVGEEVEHGHHAASYSARISASSAAGGVLSSCGRARASRTHVSSAPSVTP